MALQRSITGLLPKQILTLLIVLLITTLCRVQPMLHRRQYSSEHSFDLIANQGKFPRDTCHFGCYGEFHILWKPLLDVLKQTFAKKNIGPVSYAGRALQGCSNSLPLFFPLSPGATAPSISPLVWQAKNPETCC